MATREEIDPVSLESNPARPSPPKHPRPTHVLAAHSDGEKLTDEHWMTLEDFARLFTYGPTRTKDSQGRWGMRNDVRVHPQEAELDTVDVAGMGNFGPTGFAGP